MPSGPTTCATGPGDLGASAMVEEYGRPGSNLGTVVTKAGSEELVGQAAASLLALTGGAVPALTVVLGSGLGAVAELLTESRQLDYRSIPGFPNPTIPGHAGQVHAGRIGDLPMLVLQGREHYYENGRADAMSIALRAVRATGCGILLMTNAAGSLRREAGPGSLMVITDHINLMGINPLIGAVSDGSGFVDMRGAYDPLLNQRLHAAASESGLRLHEGVYACFSGPSFETPAEIRAAGALGANAVGMSLVPETIIARHCGLRVAAISVITNFAAGTGDEALSHQQTMRAAADAAGSVARLVEAFVQVFADDPD